MLLAPCSRQEGPRSEYRRLKTVKNRTPQGSTKLQYPTLKLKLLKYHRKKKKKRNTAIL